MDNQMEEKKSTHITLKVKNQDGNEIVFRIGRNVQLGKLMYGYCVHQKVEYNTLKFLVDGSNIRGEQTPEELELEEGDVIDAFEDQIGGGSRKELL